MRVSVKTLLPGCPEKSWLSEGFEAFSSKRRDLFGEARDASRSLGAALKGGALKMLEDAKKRKEARRASWNPPGLKEA